MKPLQGDFTHCMCSVNLSNYYPKKIFTPTLIGKTYPTHSSSLQLLWNFALGVRTGRTGRHVEAWGQVVSEEQETGNRISRRLKTAVLRNETASFIN